MCMGGGGKSFPGLMADMFQRRTSWVKMDAAALRKERDAAEAAWRSHAAPEAHRPVALAKGGRAAGKVARGNIVASAPPKAMRSRVAATLGGAAAPSW